MSVALYIWYIKMAPAICRIPNIFSALKYLSAISPIINGAIIAPQDCVENTEPISGPEALRFLSRKVPKVTNHPPQMKNSRNIIKDSLKRVVEFMFS